MQYSFSSNIHFFSLFHCKNTMAYSYLGHRKKKNQFMQSKAHQDQSTLLMSHNNLAISERLGSISALQQTNYLQNVNKLKKKKKKSETFPATGPKTSNNAQRHTHTVLIFLLLSLSPICILFGTYLYVTCIVWVDNKPVRYFWKNSICT